ncbi:MAG: SH3 domain-containing protein [Pseudomonadota bacterium]
MHLKALVLVGSLCVAGSATAQANPAFMCEVGGDGALTVTVSEDRLSADAVYALGSDHGGGGSSWVMTQVSGSPQRYESDTNEVFMPNGVVGTYEDQQGTSPCTIVWKDGDKASYLFGTAGMTLGGVVRAGPGTEYDKIGSAPAGQAVDLEQRIEIIHDGFPWFRVRFEEGGFGYIWGGILCAPMGSVQGVFDSCS